MKKNIDKKICLYCEMLENNKENLIAKNEAASIFWTDKNENGFNLIIVPNKHIFSLSVCPNYYLKGMFSALKYLQDLLSKINVKSNLVLSEEGYIANQTISHFSIKINIKDKLNNFRISNPIFQIKENSFLNKDLIEISEIIIKAKE